MYKTNAIDYSDVIWITPGTNCTCLRQMLLTYAIVNEHPRQMQSIMHLPVIECVVPLCQFMLTKTMLSIIFCHQNNVPTFFGEVCRNIVYLAHHSS